ncbi:MAG: hypothetical protein JWQ08_59 [Deinococcus sp.]|nr:hypothetical protein [Deinococcus sp.]
MRSLLVLGALSLTLSACTVNVRPNLGLSGSSSNLITSVRPDRGEGGNYVVGEALRLSVTTRTAGYVTLLALNPNGAATALVRDAYVQAGTTTFPRAQDNVTYNVAAPRGLQRVRVLFTRVRPTTDLVLGGVYDGNRWNRASNDYLNNYAPADRDVQETYLYVR